MRTQPLLIAAVAGIALTIALPASRASAQTMPSMNVITDKPGLTEEEKQKQAEQDRAYREQLKKLPAQNVKKDPWGNVRSAETPPPAPPKAKKTSTQSGSK